MLQRKKNGICVSLVLCSATVLFTVLSQAMQIFPAKMKSDSGLNYTRKHLKQLKQSHKRLSSFTLVWRVQLRKCSSFIGKRNGAAIERKRRFLCFAKCFMCILALPAVHNFWKLAFSKLMILSHLSAAKLFPCIIMPYYGTAYWSRHKQSHWHGSFNETVLSEHLSSTVWGTDLMFQLAGWHCNACIHFAHVDILCKYHS